MAPVAEIQTERLVLRAWRDHDRLPFAALNADPEVMEHFPAVLTGAQSDAMVDRIAAEMVRDGYGLWAVEVRDGPAFIGFIGLAHANFPAHFTPALEIGWRLARQAWGVGFATEGAKAVLRWAEQALDRDEIVSFTAATNLASQAVMRKIGMQRDVADDFDHPRVPEGHVLRRHVLYRYALA